MNPRERIEGLLRLVPADIQERAKLAEGTESRSNWDAHEGNVDNLMACGAEDCCSGGIEDALCNEDCPDCVEFARLWKLNETRLKTYTEPL